MIAAYGCIFCVFDVKVTVFPTIVLLGCSIFSLSQGSSQGSYEPQNEETCDGLRFTEFNATSGHQSGGGWLRFPPWRSVPRCIYETLSPQAGSFIAIFLLRWSLEAS